jgi:SAM-dependent methyltransferase
VPEESVAHVVPINARRGAWRLRKIRIVTDPDPINVDVPLSHLPPQEKAERAGSFGGVASDYERYRPGPPVAAVDWLLPTFVGRVVDLGAGTGALTRLLIDRAQEVVAVEPDDRMRSVLTEEVPGIRAVMGRGEHMPLPDSCADAVLASSSWHWMDPVPTLHEVGRILVPGGMLGALWSGPDPEGPFLVQAQALLAGRSQVGTEAAGSDPDVDLGDGEFAGLIMGDALRPMSSLEIPYGVPFDQPEHEVFTWDVALNADDLIGLLGTFSWIITMPEETRQHVIAEARRLLRESLGVEGDVTVDVAFRSDAWRSRRND